MQKVIVCIGITMIIIMVLTIVIKLRCIQ